MNLLNGIAVSICSTYWRALVSFGSVTRTRIVWSIGALAAALIAILAAAVVWVPIVGAGGILHPARRAVLVPPPQSCQDVTFTSGDVVLRGWRCPARGQRRGVIVSLHGVADNRASAVGIIDRFVARGFDVVAYDSRAHGQSSGEACTYGVLEKVDLQRVLDQLQPGPVILLGTSLGAAVALQAAADDSRIVSVIAAETFSDLRTVVTDRVPFFLTRGLVARALERAEDDGRFSVDQANPEAAAAHVRVPVLLIHGAADVDTPPAHSRRVFAALKGPKQLILVPGAAHNRSLQGDVWNAIDAWIEGIVT
jgi:pimeloyl-ACP methyl ester carboxylesterase